MIWISFDTWSSRHGHFLSWYRIYKKGKWTPFCRVGKRYGKQPEPDWKISIPDGHGDTASVAYKDISLKVISANLHVRANEPALLTLEIWAQHIEAVIGALDIEIKIVPEGE